MFMMTLIYGPARLAARTCEPVSSKQLSVYAPCEILDNSRNVILTRFDFRSLRFSYDLCTVVAKQSLHL